MKSTLKCTASKGQFSDERAIVAYDFQGRRFSLFAPADFVHESSKLSIPSHRLDVDILDREGEVVLIRLPNFILESSGGRYVSVSASDIETSKPQPASTP